jgi:hypothetical protein
MGLLGFLGLAALATVVDCGFFTHRQIRAYSSGM